MNEHYHSYRQAVADFVQEHVAPLASRLDEEQAVPAALMAKLAEKGFLGASVKQKYGGLELDPVQLCALHEEMAKGHASVENILTVAGMAALPIQRFGSAEQRNRWLPALAAGSKIAAIALTEPLAGSSLRDVETEMSGGEGQLVLNGVKRWITLGQVADLFVVLCKTGDHTVAVVVERDAPGLTITPISNMLGMRANQLAELHFTNCHIDKENIIGRPVNGIATAIAFGLDEGRFTTACGSLGIASRALELAMSHVKARLPRLGRHELVQKLLTGMIVETEAAQSFCYQAALARQSLDPSMIRKTLLAKYAASKAATSVTSAAIQVMGAAGCHADNGLERLFRDARMMEIIEGTTQVHEVLIAKEYLQN